MKRKYFATSASLVAFGCSSLGATNASAAKDAQHPNVVFILADDMGYGDVSALNEASKIHTPNIDALAKRGIIFTDAHSSSSVSTPSRYALLTGRYAFRTKMKEWTLNGESQPLMPADRSTLGTLFGKCGYSTACVGKWHLGLDWKKNDKGEFDFTHAFTEGPTERGFDYFFGIPASLDMPPYVYVKNDKVTAAPDHIAKGRKGLQLFREGLEGADFTPETCLTTLTEKAVEYLKEPERSKKPFFLYFPLTAPHTPILPTAEFEGKSGLSPYGDFVLMVDDIVRRVVSALKEKGLDENTIVVFSTDNGCAPYAGMKEMEAKGHQPNYIYRGTKADIYDGGHRIPLILSWGNHYKGQNNNDLVCLSDFYATFAQMCNVKVPGNEAEDSYSLWSILTNKGGSKRDYVVHHSGDGSFSIRDHRWKLIFCGGSGGWSFPELPKDAAFLATQPAMQLYDMKNDPSETSNIVEQHPDIVKKLSKVMKEYILNGRSTPGAKQSNDGPETWKQTKLFLAN